MILQICASMCLLSFLQKFPHFETICFVPDYEDEGELTDNLVSIALTDGVVRDTFDFFQDSRTGQCEAVALHQAEAPFTPLSDGVTGDDYTNEIHYIFGSSDTAGLVDGEKLRQLEFMLNEDRTLTPEEIVTLGDMLALLQEACR